MSLKFEQCWALARTRSLLYDLVTPECRPKTVKELRNRVFRCLRHFPPLTDTGEPMFSSDGFALQDSGEVSLIDRLKQTEKWKQAERKVSALKKKAMKKGSKKGGKKC